MNFEVQAVSCSFQGRNYTLNNQGFNPHKTTGRLLHLQVTIRAGLPSGIKNVILSRARRKPLPPGLPTNPNSANALAPNRQRCGFLYYRWWLKPPTHLKNMRTVQIGSWNPNFAEWTFQNYVSCQWGQLRGFAPGWCKVPWLIGNVLKKHVLAGQPEIEITPYVEVQDT